MATGASAVEAIAAAAGPAFPAGTVERTARVLKEAKRDLWPLGGRGGGKNAAHVQPHHLANLIMALASSQPSDAIEAVAALRTLRYAARETIHLDPTQAPGRRHAALTGQVTDRRDPEKRDFGGMLDALICDASDPGWRQTYAALLAETEISLCTAPASAKVSWPASDGIWTDHFMPPEQELPFAFRELPGPKRPGRRVSILPYDVIFAAGALWEDTLARHGRALTPPSDGGGHGQGEGSSEH